MQWRVGLLVHPSFPFIGASLDRIIRVDGQLYAIEIKCPYNPFIRKQKLAMKFKNKSFYVNLDENGKPFLKRQHPYFFQVQLQLLVSNLQSAVFIIFVPPDDIEYFMIKRDQDFIDQMLTDAAAVYSNSLLPSFAQEVAGKTDYSN
jgi:YqaJ-like viral recombinase domain